MNIKRMLSTVKVNLKAEDEKIRKLMRDCIDLKEEDEIFKKAMAYLRQGYKMTYKFTKKTFYLAFAEGFKTSAVTLLIILSLIKNLMT